MPESTVVAARVPRDLATSFELATEINGVTLSFALRQLMRAYIAAAANAADDERPVGREGPLAEPSTDRHMRTAEEPSEAGHA